MITTIALFLSIFGSILISFKIKNGFIFWSISNIIWLYDSYLRTDINQAILWSFYLSNCIIGFYIWGKK